MRLFSPALIKLLIDFPRSSESWPELLIYRIKAIPVVNIRGDEESIARLNTSPAYRCGGFGMFLRLSRREGKQQNTDNCEGKTQTNTFSPHFVEPEETITERMAARQQPSSANLVATVDISAKMSFYQSVKKSIRCV